VRFWLADTSHAMVSISGRTALRGRKSKGSLITFELFPHRMGMSRLPKDRRWTVWVTKRARLMRELGLS